MASIEDLLKEALTNKTCMKHPVAAVIETVDYQYILGWNGGPSRGKKHDKCARVGYPSGEGIELCPSIHAEIRAITTAAREGISLDGATIYLAEWFPCDNCAKSIIESGISKLVTPDEIYTNPDTYELLDNLKNQSYNFEMAEELIREASIDIVIDPSIKPK
ncbi:MAG: hypothetical protein KKA79_04370 [Nanoarchaeota archaeon]|nr:hypothetical protein [Nanoarchaeota archaeon]MCG2718218.1 deaminase [Nanoarchaeota archaeon]